MQKNYIGKEIYLAWSVYMRGKKIKLAKTIYRQPCISPVQKIYRLDGISPVLYKHVGNILLQSAKTWYIVQPSFSTVKLKNILK